MKTDFDAVCERIMGTLLQLKVREYSGHGKYNRWCASLVLKDEVAQQVSMRYSDFLKETTGLTSYGPSPSSAVSGLLRMGTELTDLITEWTE